METLMMTVNGQRGDTSKMVANDDSKEVDSILQDIDCLVNSETSSDVLDSTAPKSSDDLDGKNESVPPPKTSLYKMKGLQNKEEQNLPEGEKRGTEPNRDQQTLSSPSDSDVAPVTEQSKKLSSELLQTSCQNSTVIESSSFSVVSKDSEQTASTLSPPSTLDSSHSTQPCQTSNNRTSLCEAADTASSAEDSSQSSSQHPLKTSNCSFFQPSDCPSASNLPTSATLQADDCGSPAPLTTKALVSPATETSSSHVTKITDSISAELSDSAVQHIHNPCTVSKGISQTFHESVLNVSQDTAPDTPLSSPASSAHHVMCLSGTETLAGPVPGSDQPLTSSTKEDSKCKAKEFSAKCEDSVDSLKCEKGAVNEEDLNSETRFAESFHKDSKENTLSEKPAENSKIIKVNEENGSDKETCDAGLDPGASKSSDFGNIQILESTSMANTDVPIKEEESKSHEVETSEQSKTVSGGDVCMKEVDEKGTNASGRETDKNINNNSLHERTVSESKCFENDLPEQEKKLASEVVESKRVSKADEPPGCDVFSSGKTQPPVTEDAKKESGLDFKNDSDAVILIDEESSGEGEKMTFKNVLKATHKINKVAYPENKSSGNSMNVDAKKSENYSVVESKEDNMKVVTIDAEKLEVPSNKVGLENVKKRNVSVEDDLALMSKRRKTDETSKKDFSESSAMEVIDSDDDVILADETDANFKTIRPNQVKNSLEDKEMESKDMERPNPKDEKIPDDVKDRNIPPINLSTQVLQAFIAARIKAFIKKQKHQQLDKLNKRITSMQSSTSLWKETAKHLDRSVKEVTIINQGVEKRKAHLNAFKKFSNRTVGTQVNDDKVKVAQTAVQNSTLRPEAIAANASLGPSVLLNPPTLQQPLQNQSWTLHQVSPQPARAQAPSGGAGTPSAPSRQARPLTPQVVSQSLQPPPPPQSDVVNLIDLTDDDETVKNSPHQSWPPGGAAHPPKSVPGNRNRASKSVSSGKAAAGKVNGFIPLGPNLNSTQHPHTVADLNGQTIVTSAAAGHELVSGRQSSNVQIPNQAPGNVSGHPSSKTPGSRAPRPASGASPSSSSSSPASSSASGKHAQDSSGSKSITMHTLPPSFFIQQQRHPAPLPQATESNPPNVRALKLPPKPTLKISRVSQGIVLSWNMPPLVGIEVITSYQLFAYQETESAPKTSLWKKVGDVRALPLPMACTLTQFQEGNKYHFAVRAVDKYSRTGVFSDPSSIFLGVGSTNTKIALRG